MSFSLRGKHAIVVGGTGTLGFRIASALADRGSVVTIMSRNAVDDRQVLEPRLKPFEPLPYREDFDGGRRPTEHQFKRLDVQRGDIFKGLFPTLGPVDVLVNCAGTTFTRALALEYKSRSIRVNTLLPGWIQSPMWNELTETAREAYLKQCPLGRLGTPDEVADAAMFLITNRFANNCVLNLDGGLSAN
ncbi:hypothetical protein FOFC_10320 [Fusarium oxysporum]|nr:hypothetical protein FOFC_10320 [Fusarium oxysporum]